ncbi:hypothetical protein ACT6F8_002665 [Cronobacter dublinensis]
MKNNAELIAAGHELAKCLDNEPLLDIAKMIVRLADKLEVTTLALREKTKQCDELALKLKDVVMVRDAIAGVAEERREFIVNGVEMNFISLPKDGDADKATAVYSRCLLKPKFACDAFLREVRAQGVEMLAEHLSGLRINVSETSVRELSSQLRQGGAA